MNAFEKEPLTQEDLNITKFSERYRMIDSVKIHNFRCFESIELKDFSRINVLVGKNASGKTALLEALYLVTGGTPVQSFEIRSWRGQGSSPANIQKTSYESVWKELFYNLDQEKEIFIEFSDSLGLIPRSLRIFYTKSSLLVGEFKDEPGGMHSYRGHVVFEYKAEDGDTYETIAQLSPQGWAISGKPRPDPIIMSDFLATQAPFNSRRYADHFSSLSKRKQHIQVIKLLQGEFNFIDDITVETGTDGEPTLYASVSDIQEKIPVSVLSSGINKLLCILLGIALHPNGVFLIDEIENGFYYDRLPLIWSLVLQFAQEYQVQIFASTHSWECLQAASIVAQKDPTLFSVLRTVRSNGRTDVRQFGGDRFTDAINEGIEIR